MSDLFSDKKDREITVRQEGGIGFCGLLGLIFICAKIFGLQPIASWSWLWVLAPFWVPFVGVVIILLILLAIALVTVK